MPKFTSRHYRAIADVVAQLYKDHDDLYSRASINALVDRTCVLFERDNPAFKPDRYRAACGRVPMVPTR